MTTTEILSKRFTNLRDDVVKEIKQISSGNTFEIEMNLYNMECQGLIYIVKDGEIAEKQSDEDGDNVYIEFYEVSLDDLVFILEAITEEKTCNYFSINGYWKDDKSEFENLIVKEFDEIDEETDELVFYYGLSEKDIQEAIELKEETAHDFVITSYEPTNI